MNCQKYTDMLTEYIEDTLPEEQRQALEKHLQTCPPCRAEMAQLKDLTERLTSNAKEIRKSNLENGVINKILQKQSLKLKQTKTTLKLWRIIMKTKLTKVAAAAVILITVALSLTIFEKNISTVSAAEVLSQAVEAMANLRSVYIKAQMRTLPYDNFELILLDTGFVPVEIWKEYGTGDGRWRIEKSGRVIVMDGQSSLMLIRPNQALKAGVKTGFVSWLRPLLDVDKVLDSEIKLAQDENSELILTHEQDADGADKLVVTIEALAQGDFTHDWLKNKSIPQSNNRRIYRFDAKTKLLEALEVYVHTDENDENDVLVFEITDIEYNTEIDSSIFALELPEDVIWIEQPKVLEDNEKYQQMTPKEIATAFFQACADEDWDEFVKFYVMPNIDQRLKDIMGGVEIISIGEPFKSGLWPGWFVPYEIKRRHEEGIKKYNLAVRYDKKVKRYVVTGGF
jgi:outer membrane lipoprotein-sorting protein